MKSSLFSMNQFLKQSTILYIDGEMDNLSIYNALKY